MPYTDSAANDLIEEARTYLGTPFVHQGRMKSRGIDCAGLIACLAQWRHYAVADVKNYGREPKDGELEKALDASFHRFDRKKLSLMDTLPGMILLFEWPNGRQHIGIRTAFGMLHAFQRGRRKGYPGKRGAVVEHPLNGFWVVVFKGSYQWRDWL